PMEAGLTTHSATVAFAAILVRGSEVAPQVDLPNCGTQPPTYDDIVFDPTAPVEGGTVTVRDALDLNRPPLTVSDTSLKWAWEIAGLGFSCADTSTTHCFGFDGGIEDSGGYPVTLSLTDITGQVTKKTRTLEVANAPPQL